MKRRLWDSLALLLAALAVMHVLYWLRVLLPEPDLWGLGGGDAHEYNWLANSLRDGRGFDNIVFGLRPPVFPIFLAGLYSLIGEKPYLLIFFQMIFSALTVAMAYQLAWLLLKRRGWALLAGALMIFEGAYLDSAVTAMSEPLHNLLLIVGLAFFVRYVRRGRSVHLLAVALLLSLAMLTRPITLPFVFLLAALIPVFRRDLWRGALALIVICLVPYAAWSFRNLHYASNFSFTTTGSYTTLFYKTVAAEARATGRPPADVAVDVAVEVERRLGNTVNREDYMERAVGRPENLYSNDPRRQAVFRDLTIERSLRYPAWTVIMTGVSGLMLFMPSGDIPFLPPLVQIAYTAALLMLAVPGALVLAQRRQWLALALAALTSAYYGGVTALVMAGLYHPRYRTPFMFLIVMLAAVGLHYVLVWLQARAPLTRRSEKQDTMEQGRFSPL